MSFAVEVRAAFRRGDSAQVLRMAGAELERARSVGDAAGEVEALYAMSRVSIRGGDLVRASELASEALGVAARSGERRLEERPRHVLAGVTRMAGDFEGAKVLYLESIALNEELGQPEMVNSEYHNLAFTELHLGNLGRARELFLEGRERTFREGYDSFIPYVCLAAAALASAEGEHEVAARMVGLTDSAYAVIGQVPDPDDALELVGVRDRAIAVLGADAYQAAYEVGAAETPAEAFDRR